jgi:hypothetical protein
VLRPVGVRRVLGGRMMEDRRGHTGLSRRGRPARCARGEAARGVSRVSRCVCGAVGPPGPRTTRRDGSGRVECQVPGSAWTRHTPVPAFTGSCGSGTCGAASPALARWRLGPTGPAPVDPSLSMATTRPPHQATRAVGQKSSSRQPATVPTPDVRRTDRADVARRPRRQCGTGCGHLRTQRLRPAMLGPSTLRTWLYSGPEAIFPQWVTLFRSGLPPRGRVIGSTTVRTAPSDTSEGTDGGVLGCACNPTSRVVPPDTAGDPRRSARRTRPPDPAPGPAVEGNQADLSGWPLYATLEEGCPIST